MRIIDDKRFTELCEEVKINNIDMNVITKIYRVLYNINISDVEIKKPIEVKTYGVNYGTNIEGNAISFAATVSPNHYSTMVVLLTDYVLACKPFTFEYISSFNRYANDEIDLLMINDSVDEMTKAWLKLI
jgi:hypothetical protein